MAESFLKTGCISMQINRAELQKVRVKLSRDALTIQKEGRVSPSSSPINQPESTNGKLDSPTWKKSPSGSTSDEASSPTQKKPAPPSGERKVKLSRRKVGGLGMSIKGGRESNLPIAISRIYKDQAAYETRRLHEGDIILEVNGQSIRKATHDEAVAALKKGGSEIELTVIHSLSSSSAVEESTLTAGNTSEVSQSSISKQANGIVRSIEESSSDAEFKENSSQKSSEIGETDSNSSLQSWTDNIVLPLTFASISRYKTGEDSLRSNAFEVSSMDGGASVVLYSENYVELLSWYSAIKDRVVMLLEQSVNMSNSSLPSSEQVTFMGWVWERLRSTNHWNVWKRKFLTLKGSELQIFEMPPVVTRDWLKSEISYNLMELVCHICKEDELLDKREHCFCLQSSSGGSHYLGVDTEADLTEIVNRVQKSTHQAVTEIESRTFPGKWHGQSVKLVFDLKRGLRLYSASDRSLLWQYRFSFLRGSSDDGFRKIVLLFSASPAGPFDRQELEFTNMQQVLTVMHAFYAAKVAQVDPNFSFDNSF
ncbi:gamma-1-syntrophin-like isoform X1 [Orbicella faveolata]|uniref:gamma-1-syntrophin-like isoform X1 n=2 Tax=Orbicella faveolata TaxID=48498 RepID=UPI0009E33EB5|nr:gamma-1-syntrophin-like isoform X1 [Orbicella faveolata]